MYKSENESNFCEVIGLVETEPAMSHEIYGEKFYSFLLKVERLSKSFDLLNITLSEKLFLDHVGLKPGERIHITGQFRSYNNFSGVGNKLLLTVFVKEIAPVMKEPGSEDTNIIFLEGYLCKTPIYRVTPFGREISDLLVAVNRIHNKSDYIPCIAWGRNAKFVSNLKTGDKIKISGRIQSREYQKKISEEETVTKTAYEVSVNHIEVPGQ